MMMQPDKSLLINPVHAFSLGFGSGLMPWAPGTWGTLVAYPFYFLLWPFGIWFYVVMLILLIIASCYACDYTSKALGEHDHKSIVCDEVVGYLLVLLFTPPSIGWFLFSFFVFRLFDIFKPWPIMWFDQNLKNGTGIVVDDLLAGIYTILVVVLSVSLV